MMLASFWELLFGILVVVLIGLVVISTVVAFFEALFLPPGPKRAVTRRFVCLLVILAIAWLIFAFHQWRSEFYEAALWGCACLAILWTPAHHGARKEAESLPAFSHAIALIGNASCTRDRRAMYLAYLMSRGYSAPWAFVLGLDWLRGLLWMTVSLVAEAASWFLALSGRPPVVAGMPSARAARIFGAKALLEKLHALFRDGALSRRDVRLARLGFVPSQERAIWCICGEDGPIYTLRLEGAKIVVVSLDDQTERLFPIASLSQATLGGIAAANTSWGGVGWGTILWAPAELDETPWSLHAFASEGSLRILESWRETAKSVPAAEEVGAQPREDPWTSAQHDLSFAQRSKVYKLAWIALLSPVVSVAAAIVLIVCLVTIEETMHGISSIENHIGSAAWKTLASCVAFGLVAAIGPLPVVLGHVALYRIKRHPFLRGRSLAIAALWMGYLVTLVVALATLVKLSD